MKILVITHLFSPDRGGGASVFSDFCQGMAERGHDVEVFGGYSYYPEWKNKSGANLWKIRRETVAGVSMRRHGFYIPTRPSALWPRLAYELSYAVSILRSLFRARGRDLTIAYCPLLGSVLFAVIRKWLWGERIWLNIQDIPADAAKAAGFTNGRMLGAFAVWLQGFLFRRADYLSTISPVMVKRLDAIVGQPGKTLYHPNWLNRSMEDVIVSCKRSRGEKEQEIPILLYAGNIGRKQGLIECCKALMSSSAEFEFRIFGNGGEAGKLHAWVDECGDTRFKMGPFLSEQEFVGQLVEASYFIITETANVGASFIPSKLIPCLAVGTPVLAVCDGEGPLGREVLEFGLGRVMGWDQLCEIGTLLNPEATEYQRMSDACLERSQFYRRVRALDMVEAICRSEDP